VDRIRRSISRLARRAVALLEPGTEAHRVALGRVDRPVDYMRCAEFFATGKELDLEPGERVLDVASPQWFTLFLAERHPETTFDYINVVDQELEPYVEIAAATGLDNVTHTRQDVRDLAAADASYDRVVSLSVIEHVAPAEGGDRQALAEIRRVLKPGGSLHLTVPYKSRARTLHVEGPVYEREGGEKTFFSREYDRETFDHLVDGSGLQERARHFIVERPGLLAMDFFEWGPGRRLPFSRRVRSVKVRLERRLGRSLDCALARRYLRVYRRERYRLVNVASVLVK
jgi:SAM-dependent methyltransferase